MFTCYGKVANKGKREGTGLKRLGKILDGGGGWGSDLFGLNGHVQPRALSHKQGIQFHLHLEQGVFLNQRP